MSARHTSPKSDRRSHDSVRARSAVHQAARHSRRQRLPGLGEKDGDLGNPVASFLGLGGGGQTPTASSSLLSSSLSSTPSSSRSSTLLSARPSSASTLVPSVTTTSSLSPSPASAPPVLTTTSTINPNVSSLRSSAPSSVPSPSFTSSSSSPLTTVSSSSTMNVKDGQSVNAATVARASLGILCALGVLGILVYRLLARRRNATKSGAAQSSLSSRRRGGLQGGKSFLGPTELYQKNGLPEEEETEKNDNLAGIGRARIDSISYVAQLYSQNVEKQSEQHGDYRPYSERGASYTSSGSSSHIEGRRLPLPGSLIPGQPGRVYVHGASTRVPSISSSPSPPPRKYSPPSSFRQASDQQGRF